MFISSPLKRQYATVIAVNLIILCVGMDLGWTSPVLVKLRDPAKSPLSRPPTEDEIGRIVSIGHIVSILTLPCVGLLMDYIGRKYSILVVCLPKIIAEGMTIFATEVWVLLIARAINFSMNSMAAMIIIIYTTEIASKEIRGSLGSIFTILCSFGGLIMMGIGPYISYLNLNIMLTIITAFACIPLLFIPDTAYYLYKKGKIEKAKNVLIFFRGTKTLAEDEIKNFSKIELNQHFDKDVLKNKATLKGLIIAVVISIGLQFCGFNFIWFYLQTILDFTNTSISSPLCSLLIGLIQVLASISVSATSDRFGRRFIIITSLLGIATGMFGLGIYFTLKLHGIVISGFLNYLPLISIILITWCYNGGVGSQYWVIITELLDDRSRAIGTSISLVASSVSLFLLSRYTLAILSALGVAAAFFMFGTICILMTIFVFFVVPETKHKSIMDIQRILKGITEDKEESYATKF